MKSVVFALLCIVIPAAVLAQSGTSLRTAENSISPSDVHRRIGLLPGAPGGGFI